MYALSFAVGRARLLALLRPALGGLLWRNSKAAVADELGIPPQHHRLTSLQLSAIERHFYNRLGQAHSESLADLSLCSTATVLSACTATLDAWYNKNTLQ